VPAAPVTTQRQRQWKARKVKRADKIDTKLKTQKAKAKTTQRRAEERPIQQYETRADGAKQKAEERMQRGADGKDRAKDERSQKPKADDPVRVSRSVPK
jgi:hypothetical protein